MNRQRSSSQGKLNMGPLSTTALLAIKVQDTIGKRKRIIDHPDFT